MLSLLYGKNFDSFLWFCEKEVKIIASAMKHLPKHITNQLRKIINQVNIRKIYEKWKTEHYKKDDNHTITKQTCGIATNVIVTCKNNHQSTIDAKRIKNHTSSNTVVCKYEINGMEEPQFLADPSHRKRVFVHHMHNLANAAGKTSSVTKNFAVHLKYCYSACIKHYRHLTTEELSQKSTTFWGMLVVVIKDVTKVCTMTKRWKRKD
jgi:hypothetical protein